MRSAKPNPRFVRQCFLTLCSIFLLAGCGVSQAENPNIRNEETNIADENAVLADCFTYFYLTAWEDSNQDGTWNEDESPLEGIEFFIDGNYASSIKRGTAISDADGLATIDTWSPGECLENNVFTIRVETPEGYTLTTETPLFHEQKTQNRAEYQFGFFRLENDS